MISAHFSSFGRRWATCSGRLNPRMGNRITSGRKIGLASTGTDETLYAHRLRWRWLDVLHIIACPKRDDDRVERRIGDKNWEGKDAPQVAEKMSLSDLVDALAA